MIAVVHTSTSHAVSDQPAESANSDIKARRSSPEEDVVFKEPISLMRCNSLTEIRLRRADLKIARILRLLKQRARLERGLVTAVGALDKNTPCSNSIAFWEIVPAISCIVRALADLLAKQKQYHRVVPQL